MIMMHDRAPILVRVPAAHFAIHRLRARYLGDHREGDHHCERARNSDVVADHESKLRPEVATAVRETLIGGRESPC
jgi:hypothetical protein